MIFAGPVTFSSNQCKCIIVFPYGFAVESPSFELPCKQPTARHAPEETVQLKLAKLDCTDCVAVDKSLLSDSSPSSCVLIKKPEFTSIPMSADLQAKCHFSYPISGLCDHNGGIFINKHGDLKLTIPEGAVKDDDIVTLTLASDLYGPYILPSKRQSDVVSPYYWIGVRGSYHFQKSVHVEFQHFAVVTACDPSHFQLLCCEDNDESYTMRPAVDCNPRFTVQDDISWCSFYTDHFCSYCVYPGCKDPIINRIAALYLKTKDYQCLTHFTAEIWFSLNISQCLKRTEELYTNLGMVLDHTCSSNFKAACDKNSTNYFTLNYPENINGWDVKHSQSKNIETKEINFYNIYTDREHLKINEDKSLFPERFVVNVIKKSGCNTDLNIEIRVILHENKGEILKSIPFPLLVGMITKRPLLTDTVAQKRTTNTGTTFLLDLGLGNIGIYCHNISW